MYRKTASGMNGRLKEDLQHPVLGVFWFQWYPAWQLLPLYTTSSWTRHIADRSFSRRSENSEGIGCPTIDTDSRP
ncbi:uncharacterized protein RAG0_16714 [Rhynchosporium agropyri]|uniref:Uncharacterized protein n=1 Tax=Rhynchosporium agropyri TaxID=914238 RepID=A0A1E1LRL8_9HELO|nr:uncharacterized protein RAG0_16714 [Rhynchosporium agropyri]